MLSKRDQEILKAVHFYRYMTVLDVTYRFYSPKSESHVRELLSKLCGGKDKLDNQYLYRFGLPKAQTGNVERVYIVGARGRNWLQDNTPGWVNWYGSPGIVASLSFSALYHSLSLTRLLVAGHYWAKKNKEYKLIETRTSYQMAPRPGRGTPNDPNAIIPDGAMLFERKGKRGAVLFEIDRGTEYQERFKKHIASRVEFVQSERYIRIFGEKSVQIVYVYVGQEREARVKSMLRWAREVLKEMEMENWGSLFKFTAVGLEEIYTADLFGKIRWYSPFKKESGSLF